MGRPPAYIFIVRHGTRLDAADKQWHLSSPTPYDPPLTYGGWLQSRALGARISAILRERIFADDGIDGWNSSGPTRGRRKYKVVVHSSPFLRCIQTSIAISAGIAQEPLYPANPAGDHHPRSTPPPRAGGAARARPTLDILQSAFGGPNKPARFHTIQKSVLRLDAFLGEWLSPDYFELITPPPESVMMLASAKAELLRREDYSTYPGFTTHVHSSSQGQLWGSQARSSPNSAPVDGNAPRGLETLVGMASSLPRSSSVSSQASESRRLSVAQPAESGGYVAPIPNYAISSSTTIPLGFVAHAKDACVEVDYQWDSMRGPLEWGDGGSFGEEWTAMHRRFRRGIQNLVDWYSTTENPTEMVTKTAARFVPCGPGEDGECAVEDPEDVEAESVVILVSHGAGCNALIGAITHQPVLTDVGMASLTMAVRKPGRDTFEARPEDPATPEAGSPGPKGQVILHHYYDLRLFANTEHLRSTPTSSRSPTVANVLHGTRSRYSNSFSSNLNNFSYGDVSDSRTSSANAALSSIRRSSNTASSSTAPRGTWAANNSAGGITVGSGVTSFARSPNSNPSSLSRTPSMGLWSPAAHREEEEFPDEDDEDDMLLNFSHEKTTASPTSITSPLSASTRTEISTNPSSTTTTTAPIAIPSPTRSGAARIIDPITVAPAPPLLEDHQPEKFDELSQLGVGPGGLWGGTPRPPGEAERIRDLNGVKRRWTVNERA